MKWKNNYKEYWLKNSSSLHNNNNNNNTHFQQALHSSWPSPHHLHHHLHHSVECCSQLALTLSADPKKTQLEHLNSSQVSKYTHTLTITKYSQLSRSILRSLIVIMIHPIFYWPHHYKSLFGNHLASVENIIRSSSPHMLLGTLCSPRSPELPSEWVS